MTWLLVARSMSGVPAPTALALHRRCCTVTTEASWRSSADPTACPSTLYSTTGWEYGCPTALYTEPHDASCSVLNVVVSSYVLVQMGRCDSCRKQGYMTEKLQCLGSVRNFCNLPCLQQYCHLHFETSQHSSSNGTAPQTPYGKQCSKL